MEQKTRKRIVGAAVVVVAGGALALGLITEEQFGYVLSWVGL